MGETCASESLAAPLLTKAQAAVASLPKERSLTARRRLPSRDYQPLRLNEPSGPGEESWTAGFLFRLETTDGKPADPPTLSAAVPRPLPVRRRGRRLCRA